MSNVLYVPHDLMLMKRLWMAPALFIVITDVCVCGGGYLYISLCVCLYTCVSLDDLI